jgi:iron complex transport system substrate-binding protein
MPGLVFFCWLSLPAFCFTITDDRGANIQFDQPPQRIVSLLPSLTETLCALHFCHLLVGVDRYSNYPDSVQKLPKLGGGLDPNIEAVVAARPDLVLLATSSPALNRLQSLGLKVAAFEPKNYADVHAVILKAGQLLQIKDAESLWKQIESDVDAVAASLPESTKNIRVYFETNQGPYAASEQSFIGETLNRLRLKNTVPANLGVFPRLNPEFVVRANPDLMMLGESSAKDLSKRPGWSRIKALQQKNICVFSQSQSDVLMRPGPRIPEAAKWIANCLLQHTSLTTPIKP